MKQAFNLLSSVFTNSPVWLIGVITMLALPIAVSAYTGGKTAEVTSKEFVCTATSAVGITPQCDQYTRVKGSLEPGK